MFRQRADGLKYRQRLGWLASHYGRQRARCRPFAVLRLLVKQSCVAQNWNSTLEHQSQVFAVPGGSGGTRLTRLPGEPGDGCLLSVIHLIVHDMHVSLRYRYHVTKHKSFAYGGCGGASTDMVTYRDCGSRG